MFQSDKYNYEIIEGIGIATCVFVTPKTPAYWIIDYRLYDVECRQHRAQCNHIACCLWVWVSLTRAARAAGQTIYQLKESLLDDYIRQQLQKPIIFINVA